MKFSLKLLSAVVFLTCLLMKTDIGSCNLVGGGDSELPGRPTGRRVTEVTELIRDDDDYDDGDASTWGTAGGVVTSSSPPSNATSAPIADEKETTAVESPPATLGACARSKCGANKACVEDPGYRLGYRCCRKLPCKYEAGRFCDDPGSQPNMTRQPKVRKHRKFRPRERVIFRCPFGEFQMVCQDSGLWRTEPPSNACLNPNLRIVTPGDVDWDDQELPPSGEKTSTREKITIGLIVAGIGVLVFATSFFIRFFRLRFKMEMKQERMMHCYRQQPVAMPDLANTATAVSIECFEAYVNERHNASDFLFLQEFQTIQNESSAAQYTTEASNLMENVEKNRYNNIVAYDHSRVHLKDLKKQDSPSDYINANYVSGFTNLQAFIACQGPLPSTFSDFWEMVWNNNVNVIVMITNLIENGRRKCDQYWPSEGKESHKYITVSAKSTETYANYTIRTFILKNNKFTHRPGGGERKIVQYHYTQWPDHGTPDYILPVLSFIRKSSSGDQTAPIVVHCSAGVGRTGTYIAIQSMIQMLLRTGSVNVPTFLRHIRTQRNHLVQTQDQYVFVHDAVLEFIKIGDTEIKRGELLSRYNHLVKQMNAAQLEPAPAPVAADNDDDAEEAGDAPVAPVEKKKKLNEIEKQFEHMKQHLRRGGRDGGGDGDGVSSSAAAESCTFATRTVNRHKNRQGALLPIFKSCVRLRGDNNHLMSEEGSEYINASYMQGYRNSGEFIVTQLPMEETRKDFWQLVWDANCSTIVTLGDEEWDNDTDKYWPEQDQPSQFSSFKVTFSHEETLGGVVQRTFVLEATKDDYVLMVRQFHVKCWAHTHPTRDNADLVAAVSAHASGKEGSTIVQDRYGSTPAAQFACWSSMHDRLAAEERVDVYQTCMLACQMRPGVFTTLNHLLYLYELAVMEAKMTDRSGGNSNSLTDTPTTSSIINDLTTTVDVSLGEEAVKLLTFNQDETA